MLRGHLPLRNAVASSLVRSPSQIPRLHRCRWISTTFVRNACGGALSEDGARSPAFHRCSGSSTLLRCLYGGGRFYATSSSRTPLPPAEDGGDGGEFEFDVMSSVRHDAAVEAAKQSLDHVVAALAPPNAPPAALSKIRAYVQQHPVDTLIIQPQVQITHIENPETGVEEKANLSATDTAEALEQAQLRGLHLVQMGSREGVAFCRLRNERPRLLKLVEAEMEGVDTSSDGVEGEMLDRGASGSEEGGRHGHSRHRQYTKTRELVDHQFRDVVDAHFVGWRSKKMVQDLRKGHPVKATIKDFQSPEAAINKLREMSNAMKAYAEEEGVYHHFTSIVANDREASISFSPASANKSGTIAKTVKHPGEKEWGNALRRMGEACRKAGHSGTYAKSGKLKPRSLGTTMYRVDKYGRRVD